MFLMDPMVLSVLYVWCQLNKDVIVTFWYILHFLLRDSGDIHSFIQFIYSHSLKHMYYNFIRDDIH